MFSGGFFQRFPTEDCADLCHGESASFWHAGLDKSQAHHQPDGVEVHDVGETHGGDEHGVHFEQSKHNHIPETK